MKPPSIRSAVLAAACALALGACDPRSDTTAPTATQPAQASAPVSTTDVPEQQTAAPPVDAAPAATPADSATGNAGEQAVDEAIDRVLGDHARYRAVFAQLQHAVAAKDAAAVANLVAYPFTATIDGRKVKLADAAAFTARYERIVTPAIARTIAKQEFADAMVSAKGVMLGGGEVWLNGACRDRACAAQDVKVIAIQPGPD